MDISDEETSPQFDRQMEEMRRQNLTSELIRKTVELITCDIIKSVENDVKRVSLFSKARYRSAFDLFGFVTLNINSE